MSDDTGPQGSAHEDAHVRAWRRRLATSYVLILVCLAVVAVAAYRVALSIDRAVRLDDERQVARIMAREANNLGTVALEYAYWNVAVDEIVYERDAAWADQSVSKYMVKTYDVSSVLATDRSGDPVYRYRSAAPFPQDGWRKAEAVVERLRVELESGDPADPGHAASYAMVDGGLVLFGAAPFTAYAPSERRTDIFHGTLYLAQRLDAGLLSRWAERYGLPELSVKPVDTALGATQASAVVEGIDSAPVARMTWTPAAHGRDAIAAALPWSVSLAGVALVATVLFAATTNGLVRTARSNIAELDEQRDKLYRQAMYDEVTGLHNRNYLMSRLEEELARIRREGTSAVFIFIDLDGFKMVNDMMGHSAGDDLLRRVGDRLADCVRREDVVCRFGGDEFCILVPGIQERRADAVRAMADRIASEVVAKLEGPFTIHDKPTDVGASAGIVVIPDDTADLEDILRFGDLAMYRAKMETGSAFIYYRKDFLHDVNYRNAVRHKLEVAVDNREVSLHYQPVHDATSGAVVGYETLARWDSPELGRIGPDKFIAIAEESDTIIRLGRWILDRALRDHAALAARSGGACFVSINVSARQAMRPEFSDDLADRIAAHGVPPEQVYLELTEGYRLGRGVDAPGMLERISRQGVRIMLDDVGTGYAFLSYLRRYPLDAVKIDREFVRNVVDDDRSSGIVRAIAQMAESLDIRVVAVGVETEAQERILRANGCEWFQGFRYGRPEPLGD